MDIDTQSFQYPLFDKNESIEEFGNLFPNVIIIDLNICVSGK